MKKKSLEIGQIYRYNFPEWEEPKYRREYRIEEIHSKYVVVTNTSGLIRKVQLGIAFINKYCELITK